MEKEMKILENYIYNKKETMKEQLVKSIEKLIKEYKNLQQIEQEHKKENGALREIIKELEQNQCTHNIDNECIRKSKVKEKIAELEKRKKYLLDANLKDIGTMIGCEDCDEKITLYKELLEE